MRKVSREMPAEWALEVMRKAPYITVSFIRKDGSAYGLPLSLASAEDGECSVRWGEGGTCVFLARPEDVAKGDFSNVLYHWDGN